MNCDEVQELLSPYADNMLEPGETKIVSEHLKTCSDCSQEYKRLQALIDAFKSMEEEDLPEGFCVRLHDRLIRETQSSAPPAARKRLFIPSWFPVGAVAAVLIALFMGLSPAELGIDGLHLDSAELEQSAIESNQASNESYSEDSDGAIASKISIDGAKPAQEEPQADKAAKAKQEDSGINTYAGPPDALLQERDTVSNGFRAESARRENTENRGGDAMFKASGLLPFDAADIGDTPVSSPELSDMNTVQVAPFIHLRVDSLDNFSAKLIDIAKSLGGEVKATSNQKLGRAVAAAPQTYTASIPCSSLKAFKDSLANVGDVVSHNLNTAFGNETRCVNTIDELQNRKKVLTELLMHTSDVEKIRQLNQEIADIDKEIVQIQSSPLSASDSIEINIIIEEK